MEGWRQRDGQVSADVVVVRGHLGFAEQEPTLGGGGHRSTNLREQRDPSVPKDEGVFSWCHLCSPVFSPGLIRPRLAHRGLTASALVSVPLRRRLLADRWSRVHRRSSRVHLPLAPPSGLHCSRLPEG